MVYNIQFPNIPTTGSIVAGGIEGATAGVEQGVNLAQLSKQRKAQTAFTQAETGLVKAKTAQSDPLAIAGRNFHVGTSYLASIQIRMSKLAAAIKQAPNPELEQQYQKLNETYQAIKQGVTQAHDLLTQAGIDPNDPKNLSRFGISIEGMGQAQPMAPPAVPQISPQATEPESQAEDKGEGGIEEP